MLKPFRQSWRTGILLQCVPFDLAEDPSPENQGGQQLFWFCQRASVAVDTALVGPVLPDGLTCARADRVSKRQKAYL